MLDNLKFAVTGEHPSWSCRDSPDEATYQVWKCPVVNMWLSHATLDEHHALIETRARLKLALARQVRQHQELTPARTIFLWLRQHRLHARLARQTSRRQLHEAALARLRYEQECSECAALAEKQRLAAAAARATALDDAAVEQRIREALANEHRRYEADVHRLWDSLADECCRQEATNLSVNLALVKHCRLAEERRHHEAAKQAAASAERALAEERCRHDASAWAAASAELALAKEHRAANSAERALAEERCRHDASARAAALAELALVEEGRRHNIAAQAAESAALALAEERRRHEAAAQTALLAEAALADERLRLHTAEDCSLVDAGRHDTATVSSPASPARIPAAIRRIQAACDTLAAPLDALLAEFAALAVDTAPPSKTSPVPTATLTPSPRPRSYLDAVVGPNGRGYTSSAPPSPSATPSPLSASAPTTPTVRTSHRAKPRRRKGGTQPSLPLAGSPALPSPDVDSQRQTVRPRARPRRRTGRRNIPRAPSSFVKVAPTHPELLQGGLPTPTPTMLARATSPCCSVVSSPTPASTTPHPPSLHPFTFDDGTIHSSEGGNAHPFRARGLPLPPWKRTRRKYRPHRTCRRHQPRAPNQSTGWA